MRWVICVEVVLLILSSVAFLASFFGGLGVMIDLNEEWRFIAVLEANPNRHLGYMRDAFFYLITFLTISMFLTSEPKNLMQREES